MVSTATPDDHIMGPCTRDRQWRPPVVAMLITFFAGLVILVPCRLIWYKMYGQQQKKNSMNRKYPVFARVRAKAQYLLSGNGIHSKIIVIGTFLVNLAAVILYLIDASMYYNGSVECGPVLGEVIPTLWVVFSIYFLIIFLTRFVAAADKLYMWIDPTSIVDHLTIIPTLMSIYLDRNWFAFRCLRVLHLIQTAEILQLIGLLKHRSSIRIVQVVSFFMAVWLAASGFVHVTENSGDPFYDYSNGQDLPYWKGFYWLLVTMSTVGYGDVNPATDITKVFIIVFIMGSFAMFSSLIPELIHHLDRPKYCKDYRRSYGKKHIVVCGRITYENVNHLLRNLEHEDALTGPIDVVFVSEENPSLELEAFFRRRCSEIFFYRGTVMDLRTLVAVKLIDAEAAIIMTNKMAEDPDEEDSLNVMRAAALKNFNHDIRIIIQLLQQHNKTHLLHIPKWRWKPLGGDQVVCLSELKFGIIAQSCLAPGITTLLSNLFTNRSFKHIKEGGDWTQSYKLGAGNEIYVEAFSSAFSGMNFKQAAEICFTQLEVLLVALENRDRQGLCSQLKINPGDHVIIRDGAVGFFFAQGPEQAQRVSMYRDSGNKHIRTKIDDEAMPDAVADVSPSYFESMDGEGSKEYGVTNKGEEVKGNIYDGGIYNELFDPTGDVYWCPPQQINDCIIDVDVARQLDLHNHIVVQFNASNLTDIGLASLVMPLRASCIHRSDLKDIVLIIDPALVQEEWPSIHCIPRLFLFKPTSKPRRDLKVVNVTKCAMCLVLDAGYAGKNFANPRTVDRQAILSSLSIQTMFGMSPEERLKAVGGLTEGENPAPSLAASGEVPMVTVLEHDENIVFLDPEDCDNDLTSPLYLKVPYASGRAFTISCLDSLLSCTYLNSEVLRLVRALITGSEVADYEVVLLDGLGITRKKNVNDVSATRRRSHLAQLSLAYGPLEKLEHKNVYGTLFTVALHQHNFLCLGVYRLFEPESPNNRKRYVITNPPYQFELLPSDRIYVLKPFLDTPSDSRQSSVDTGVNALNGKSDLQDTPL